MTTLVLSGVSRSFDGRTVLDDVSLTIEDGEVVALLGQSGVGKTTLLRIVAGLDQGFDGTVDISGNTAVVFQDARLMPWKRVLANVVLGLDAVKPDTVGLKALEEVGLSTHVDSWPKTLSGGEMQRAALARALVREPKLLLLDEPFGALDALTRLRMQDLFLEICARHRPAALLITHDVEEALVLANRVIVLKHGRFVFEETIDLDQPRHRTSPEFQELRARLLNSLGVDGDGETS